MDFQRRNRLSRHPSELSAGPTFPLSGETASRFFPGTQEGTVASETYSSERARGQIARSGPLPAYPRLFAVRGSVRAFLFLLHDAPTDLPVHCGHDGINRPPCRLSSMF